MLEYLEKFKKLSQETRARVSSVKTTQIVNALEEKYGIKLATLIIRVAIKDVALNNLKNVLISEFGLDDEKAGSLEKELREKVLISKSSFVKTPEKEERFLPKMDSASSPQAETKSLPKRIELDHLLPTSKNRPKVADFNDKKSISRPVSEQKDISFFDEDKKEIEEIKKMSPQKKINEGEEAKGRIGEIIREAKISFSSDILLNRFKQIIATYLLGVRNRVATKEIMMRTVENGGLGLDDEKASKIMITVLAKKDKEESGKNINIKTTKDGSNFIFNKQMPKTAEAKDPEKEQTEKNRVRDVDYDLASALREKRIGSLTKDVVKPSLVKQERKESPSFKKESFVMPIAGAQENKKKEALPDKEKFTKDSVLGEKIGSLRSEVKKPEVVRTGSKSQKKKIDGIKTPRVMSPVDELSYMDLVAFRRIDDRPLKRIKKIKAKIDLLAKEGIDKLIAGVKAWRNSPVNKTYLQTGEESMNEGKSIDDIIKIRKDKGLNYLEKDEFEAVMDLNRQLKF